MTTYRYHLNKDTDVLPDKPESISISKSSGNWVVNGLNHTVREPDKLDAINKFLQHIYNHMVAPQGYPAGGEISHDSYRNLKQDLTRKAKEPDEGNFPWKE